MQQNIKKVAERGERLDSLQDKTGEYEHVGIPMGTSSDRIMVICRYVSGFCARFQKGRKSGAKSYVVEGAPGVSRSWDSLLGKAYASVCIGYEDASADYWRDCDPHHRHCW